MGCKTVDAISSSLKKVVLVVCANSLSFLAIHMCVCDIIMDILLYYHSQFLPMPLTPSFHVRLLRQTSDGDQSLRSDTRRVAREKRSQTDILEIEPVENDALDTESSTTVRRTS